jgi:hypothetical protein
MSTDTIKAIAQACAFCSPKSGVLSRVEKRRSDSSLPVAIGGTFTRSRPAPFHGARAIAILQQSEWYPLNNF